MNMDLFWIWIVILTVTISFLIIKYYKGGILIEKIYRWIEEVPNEPAEKVSNEDSFINFFVMLFQWINVLGTIIAGVILTALIIYFLYILYSLIY